jgi:aspartate-semialdehyde dehydrogenase
MSVQYPVTVVGATGLVGETLVELLAARDFPVSELVLVASRESAGRRLPFGEGYCAVKSIEGFSFPHDGIVFLCANAPLSRELASLAIETGNVVIDLTGALEELSAPVVVPGVNEEAVFAEHTPRMLANPTTGAILLASILRPLQAVAGLRRVQAVACVPASQSGRAAVEGLGAEAVGLLNAQPVETTHFPQQLAFNVLPAVGDVQPSGATRLEEDVAAQVASLLGEAALPISVSALQIPAFFGYGMVICLETERHLPAAEAHALLAATPGIELMADVPAELPTPVSVSGSDAIQIARLRDDPAWPHGLSLWAVTDNTRKGAALNAIQAAELLVKQYL